MVIRKNFRKESKRKRFRVSIFGSARIKKNDPVYKQVHKLAKMLGEHGVDVVTGGGPGIMEAANTGHSAGSKRSKATSYGLNIKLPHEQFINPGVQTYRTFKRFSSRLDNFMLLSNAVVVAHGGVGTLLELFYTWQVLQVEHICHIPIILMGEQWHGLIDWLENQPLRRKYFEKKDLELLFFANTSEEAMRIIEDAHKEFKKGNKNFCMNYDKYTKT